MRAYPKVRRAHAPDGAPGDDPTPIPPPPTYTPIGLSFDEATHRYVLDGIELISVTTALQAAALVDLTFATEASRALGLRVHAAIELLNATEGTGRRIDEPADVAPYLRAYRAFLAETAFRIHACEERLADQYLGVAGTCDLRGQFRDAYDGVVDIIDIKTGEIPPWVGYQTAGYVRLLPYRVRLQARRFVLQLRGDGSYRLRPLTTKSDEAVFLAAVTIARAKRGWL